MSMYYRDQAGNLVPIGGIKGKDGTSVTHKWEGTKLIISSAAGTSEQDLKGDPGNDGYTPVKNVDYFDGNDGDPGVYVLTDGETIDDAPENASVVIDPNGEPMEVVGLSITGAAVGQTVRIAEVDENGVPTKWETVNFSNGNYGGSNYAAQGIPPEDTSTLWIDTSDNSHDAGGNVDVTIEGETLVIAENSTATIDGETLIL